VPRLAYITDKGSAPDDYYRRVLKKMGCSQSCSARYLRTDFFV
jgi:hypothetical protein